MRHTFLFLLGLFVSVAASTLAEGRASGAISAAIASATHQGAYAILSTDPAGKPVRTNVSAASVSIRCTHVAGPKKDQNNQARPKYLRNQKQLLYLVANLK